MELCIGGQSALSLVSVMVDSLTVTLHERYDHAYEQGADTDFVKWLDYKFGCRSFWKGMMSTFTDSVCAAPRVNILEAVRNTYERIYRNKEFADVVLVGKVNAPSDDPVEFRAHALVLKSASVVFGAMLGGWITSSVVVAFGRE